MDNKRNVTFFYFVTVSVTEDGGSVADLLLGVIAQCLHSLSFTCCVIFTFFEHVNNSVTYDVSCIKQHLY